VLIEERGEGGVCAEKRILYCQKLLREENFTVSQCFRKIAEFKFFANRKIKFREIVKKKYFSPVK